MGNKLLNSFTQMRHYPDTSVYILITLVHHKKRPRHSTYSNDGQEPLALSQTTLGYRDLH